MKSRQSFTSDIISNLPSNVTDNILDCLPLRDAVRMCALSSRWRYKWVTLTKIIIDEKICRVALGNKQLKTIIYQVLLLHNGPLLTFKLPAPQLRSCLDINHWILILLKKNVQQFILCLPFGQDHKLSFHLFLFLQLRHLDLCSCEFKPPPTFKGFCRLVKLYLQDVRIAHEMFANFISNCPLLEQLVIHDCTRFDCLEINATNLLYFGFIGTFKSICFFRTSLLAEIAVVLTSIDADINQHEEGKDSNLVKFFHSLPAIENLILDDYILEFLAVGNVTKRLPSTLNRLKTLDLCYSCFGKISEVSCALCLIRSSPSLQELKIAAKKEGPVDWEAVAEFLQAQDFSDFTLNRLRKVKMGQLSVCNQKCSLLSSC